MIKVPGQNISIRLFDRVETTDKQYGIWDIGVQHEDGSIDSVAFGGSAASARRWIDRMNADAENKSEDKKQAENKVVSTGGPAPVAAVNDQPPGSVSDWDGNDLDIEGL